LTTNIFKKGRELFKNVNTKNTGVNEQQGIRVKREIYNNIKTYHKTDKREEKEQSRRPHGVLLRE